MQILKEDYLPPNNPQHTMSPGIRRPQNKNIVARQTKYLKTWQPLLKMYVQNVLAQGPTKLKSIFFIVN